MYCIKCGEKLGEHDKYCKNCGYCNDDAEDNDVLEEKKKISYKWIPVILISSVVVFLTAFIAVRMINNNNKPKDEITFVSDTEASESILREEKETSEIVDNAATISYTNSSEASNFEMPDVVGETETDAKKTLTEKGLSVSVTYRYDSSVEDGIVLEQNIEAGEDVKRGDSITLVVCSNDGIIVVADVVGKTEDEASEILTELGFKVSITETYSDSLAEGYVISQSLRAGSNQEKDTQIFLTVSKGKEKIESISVITQPTKNSYYVGDILNTAGLTLKATYNSGNTVMISSGYTCDVIVLSIAGIQVVTISYEGKETTFEVTVENPSISITVNYSQNTESFALDVGDETMLRASTTPDGDVNWSSDNVSVATVSGGNVTAISEGSATISADFIYGGITYSTSVIVIVTTPYVASGNCGDNLTWTLDTEGVLTISGSGDMYNYPLDGEDYPWDSIKTSIKSIVIEKGITNIENGAFDECTNLVNVIIPEGITYIGWLAFSGCTSLTSVKIPSSVTSMGIYVFYECTSLVSVDIENGLTNIGQGAFTRCTSLISVTIPDSVVEIGEWAFNGCTGLTSIIIPNSVATMSGSVFYDWTASQTIYIKGYTEAPSGWVSGWTDGCEAVIVWKQ